MPLPLLLVLSLFSTLMERQLPFGMELKTAGRKAFWGETFFRFLWSVLFFDLIPAWLFFQFRPELFSSIAVTALVVTATIFLLGFIPLAILLGSRYNFDWGYLLYTLFWVFAALALSLGAIQAAYRI